MKPETFNQGLKTVETGLQGSFQAKFIDFLWKAVQEQPDEAWTECCRRLGLGGKKLLDLIAGDFMAELRVIAQERAHRESVWKIPCGVKKAPNWDSMAEKICSDPEAAPLSKDIARTLASRGHDPAPMPRGGERYRPKD